MTAEAQHGQRFAGDRYQRLRQAATVAADDPAVTSAPFPFDAEGLSSFVERIAARRLLDALSDRDADWVSMILTLDFPEGPAALAIRVRDYLATVACGDKTNQRARAIGCALAGALHAMTDVFVQVGGAEGDETATVSDCR
jgi:hypothetical protein